jgi:hypothetical protein
MAAHARSDSIVKQPAQPAAQLPGSAPAGYAAFLADIKSRIRTAQIKASLSVNCELIELYWGIGRDIVARQKQQGWSAKVIDRLAADLRQELPGTAGFSRANIYRMRAFHLAYQPTGPIVSHAGKVRITVNVFSERVL